MHTREDFFQRIEENRTFSPAERELISVAYDLAEKYHAGQKRKSGEPYFIHPREVAIIAAHWGVDATTIAAALLHDTLEDTTLTAEKLEKAVGKEVVFIVNGVTKIGYLKYRGNEEQVETLRKMILALGQDIRVVFVKLADRMHNMRTLTYLPLEKRRRIALETTDIYAPLAYRMGLGAVAGELEDLAFPHLYPEEYTFIRTELAEHFATGEAQMQVVYHELEELLKRHSEIKVIRLDSRAKRISSLYKKLQRKNMNIEEIHDLIALRVIVEDVEDCYATLGVIHAQWPPLPGKIHDYIALPKPNGYRSLHTTVVYSSGKPIEIQIRTEEMHVQAEYGISAYWAYQEAKKSKAYRDERRDEIRANPQELSWINQLKQWQQQFDSEEDFLQSLKIDFFRDRIFVVTPKGEAIDLPAGATPIDFAYAIHGEVGDHCIGARVNNRIVPLAHELQSGDLVEIIISKTRRPNEAWLEFVKTSRARSRIRSALRKEGKLPTHRHYEYHVTYQHRVGIIPDISQVFQRVGVSPTSVQIPRSQAGVITNAKFTTGDDVKEKISRLQLKIRQVDGVREVRVVEVNE